MKLKIRGKKKLQGVVKISGSKNSAVAILAASILADEEVTIRNIPEIDDIKSQINILEEHGYSVYFKDNIFKIKPLKKIKPNFLSDEISKLRGSCYFMGACLAKYHHIKIKKIGGCNLGKRPLNYHFDGFKKLNIKVKEKENKDYVILKTNKIIANTIKLPFPSVGATINLLLASVKAKGTVTIENAAIEPEVADLGNFLISMGAKIEGLSTDKIKITGVDYLHHTDYIISNDRIEAGTYLILGAMATGNGITIENVQPYYLKSLIEILRDSGVEINTGEHSIFVKRTQKLKPIDVNVGVYPSFPTDHGPLISIYMTQIEGTSSIQETIFDNRFSHVEEIKKTNVLASINGKTLYITGKSKLNGAYMCAYDLRCAAALVLCACMANGISTIDNIEVLFRGYEKPVEKLKALGLNVTIENKSCSV